jgi:hypothetical protein
MTLGDTATWLADAFLTPYQWQFVVRRQEIMVGTWPIR